MNMLGTVSCGLCSRQIEPGGTGRCDRCYELQGRIQDDPEIARKILAAIDADVPFCLHGAAPEDCPLCYPDWPKGTEAFEREVVRVPVRVMPFHSGYAGRIESGGEPGSRPPLLAGDCWLSRRADDPPLAGEPGSTYGAGYMEEDT